MKKKIALIITVVVTFFMFTNLFQQVSGFDGGFTVLRGYDGSSTFGSVSQISGGYEFKGIGAAYWNNVINLKTNTTITMNITPKAWATSGNEIIGLNILDRPQATGQVTETANGVQFRILKFGTGGYQMQLWKVVNGTATYLSRGLTKTSEPNINTVIKIRFVKLANNAWDVYWDNNETPVKIAAIPASDGILDSWYLNNQAYFSLSTLSGNFVDFTVTNLNVSNLRLHDVYAANMLFQQNKPIVISGVADEGHTVTATLYQDSTLIRSGSAVVDSNGEWVVSMPGLAGGYVKYRLEISDNGLLSSTLNDIVIGELWLASGQSNMQYMLLQTPTAVDLLNNPTEEYLRFLYMPNNSASGSNAGSVPYEGVKTVNGAFWTKGTEASKLRVISSVAYYFAAQLREELDMPVGILNAAQGATPIYGWLSREAIESDNTVKTYLQSTSRYLTESNWNQAGDNNYRQMTAMYNQKIAPLLNFHVSGMIWYQGEDQVGETNGTYQKALDLLQRDYSSKFGFENGDMPLIYAHLAPHFYGVGRSLDKLSYFAEDLSDFWQTHRESTAQITIYDIGLGHDYSTLIPGQSAAVNSSIHPYEKQPVGERMAAAALNLVYGGEGEYSSPTFSKQTIENGSITVKFNQVGDGLSAIAPKVGYTYDEASVPVRGFAIAGSDGIYVTANAEIISADTVRVWSDTVKHPVSVTYGFTSMNSYSNLAATQNGKISFPVVPFRSVKSDGQKNVHPLDWSNFDFPTVWRNNGSVAKQYDAWTQGTQGTAAISYDASVKTEGTASLKFDYTTSGGSASIAAGIIDPATSAPFTDSDHNYSRYQTATLQVKNESGHSGVVAELRFKGNDNIWYSACPLGATGAGKTLTASSGWQTVTFDLSYLRLAESQNATVYTAAQKLTAVKSLELVIRDTASTGTVYFDELVFGFSEDKAEVDKYPLSQAIEKAQALDLSAYTAASVTILNSKLEAAKNVLDSLSATQTQVDTATEELTDAIDNLIHVVDKDDLQTLVDEADKMDFNVYTPSTVALLIEKLNAAKAVLLDTGAADQQITDAYHNLSQAKNKLTPMADKGLLERETTEAMVMETTNYTSDSVEDLWESIAAAKTVLEDANASQTQVDAALEALSTAVKALVRKDAGSSSTPPSSTPSSSEPATSASSSSASSKVENSPGTSDRNLYYILLLIGTVLAASGILVIKRKKRR